jgi:two-component system CheB/CheR fusion protein
MKSKLQARGSRRKTTKIEKSGSREAREDFLIAAIGASAGGIEAFIELVRSLPADTGMAFVLIQHLDPKHHSILTELISKETTMRVVEVKDGMRVGPNHIYVIPPNTTMSISERKLRLGPREEALKHMSIDHFMRSLAEAQGNRAIGVILSGTGTDGTLGMGEIQAQGGVTLVQDETTAKYEGMPRSAIAAGCVDYVLPPREIARELGRIARHPYVAHGEAIQRAELVPAENVGLNAIFQLLRRTTGVDFTHYRQTTILRRVQRRMVVHKLDRLEDYVRYIQTNPAEVKALHQDVLINVTSFFRNPRVFEALKSKVFAKILKNRRPETSIRIWTPGCATGEETYSVAIVLLEFLEKKAAQLPIQFFGTDVSEANMVKARAGFYPENIQGDVSPERLRRFFTKAEGGYRISKSIRDMCIFAQHNVVNDPPFSNMDLICCRNLLIYLEPVLQNRAISLFHYATRPDGFLVLGTSETIGTAANLFAMEDRKHKIFSKKATALRQPVAFSLNRQAEHGELGVVRAPALAKAPESNWNYMEAQKEFDRRLLAQYVPATVFVNDDMEIIHTRGNVGGYLKIAPGRASLNILKMAREGLLLELRNALDRAKKENAAVRKQNVQIKNGRGDDDREGGVETARRVSFEVLPLRMRNLKEFYFMIVFQEVPPDTARKAPRTAKPTRESDSTNRRIAKLEQELGATKEYLQSVIETQEATNEELQSANEEILSSNEELQSTNEELETAKEELQSTNEELSTVNDELRDRNTEVTQTNSDLTSFFGSINIAMVMVGSDLTIRRFTPQAQKLFGLIPGDVGRPLLNINPTIEIPNFQQLVLQVMSNFSPAEKECTGPEGSLYQLRILPSRTTGKKVDGAVITLAEISPRRLAERA